MSMLHQTRTEEAFTEDLSVHVPTLVMQRQYKHVDKLNEALAKYVDTLAEQFEDSQHNAARSGQVTTEGGFQTSLETNLFQHKSAALKALRDEIVLPAAHHYLATTFGEEADKLKPWPVGWAVKLRAGDWQRPHWHPSQQNMASGVYYVRIPQDRPNPEGRIEFLNPLPQSLPHGHPAHRRLHPAEGKLFLFPPYYVHYVHPFHGDQDRIVIAFDIFAQPPGLQFTF